MDTKIIIYLETTKGEKSDKIYVDSVINSIEYDKNKYSINYEFLHGKQNAFKVPSNIKDIRKTIKNNGPFSDLIVIICVDKDNATTDPRDVKFLKKLENMCNENEIKLVYFNKNIEDVFIGKTIKKDKTKIALEYKRKNNFIVPIEIRKNLMNNNPCTKRTSNLINVLNEILN